MALRLENIIPKINVALSIKLKIQIPKILKLFPGNLIVPQKKAHKYLYKYKNKYIAK